MNNLIYMKADKIKLYQSGQCPIYYSYRGSIQGSRSFNTYYVNKLIPKGEYCRIYVYKDLDDDDYLYLTKLGFEYMKIVVNPFLFDYADLRLEEYKFDEINTYFNHNFNFQDLFLYKRKLEKDFTEFCLFRRNKILLLR